jgi:hypothetical protein
MLCFPVAPEWVCGGEAAGKELPDACDGRSATQVTKVTLCLCGISCTSPLKGGGLQAARVGYRAIWKDISNVRRRASQTEKLE